MRRIYYPVPVAASAYDDLVLSLKPVAYWPLDETSGPVAHDITGNGYDGTYSSGVTLGAASPPMGGVAPHFGGAGKVTTGYKPGALASFTAVAWIDDLATAWAPTIVATNDAFNDATGWNLLIGELSGQATISSTVRDTAGNRIQAQGGIAAASTQWAMVVCRWSSQVTPDAQTTEGLAFIDGSTLGGIGGSSTTAGLPASSSGNPLLIAGPYGADSYYNGDMAQIAFWEGRLTNSDLAKLWLAAVPNG